MKTLLALLISFALTAPALANVSVSQPSNGSTTGSPVQFVASATTSCSRGVASMGVYINGSLKYVTTGKTLNTAIALSPGTYRAAVQEWDNCGGASNTPLQVNVTGGTGVHVSSPANNSTVTPSVNFVATASTNTCPQGVASMGVYVNGQRLYVVNGASMNTVLTLGSGKQNVVVQEWDHCGGSTKASLSVNVQGTQQGKVLSNLQASGGWDQWGELAPNYNICTSCTGVTWSMQQHIPSPSKSGNATRFNLGGTTRYSDALFSNKIMGQGSTQGLSDSNRTLIPKLHNFVLDTDVYVTNAGVTQSLEFDVNMYLNGVGMEWGSECSHLDDGQWEIWDNASAHWVPTGVACTLSNGWHHLTLQVQRESNNDLLYQSITWDGKTYTINRTMAPFKVPYGWYGMTVNYQMDGNYKQADYQTYVDNMNLRYW